MHPLRLTALLLIVLLNGSCSESTQDEYSLRFSPVEHNAKPKTIYELIDSFLSNTNDSILKFTPRNICSPTTLDDIPYCGTFVKK